MKDKLPQTGEGVRGERLSSVRSAPEDIPNPPQLDLGDTYGTDFNTENLGGVTGGIGEAEAEEGLAEEVTTASEGSAVSEDTWGTSARPVAESAFDCYQRKFGGGK